MAHIKLDKVNIHIPIYDSNALRLFRRKSLGAPGSVGSRDFDSSGVLRVQALKDFSLKINDGDRVALIGHNGAGKTSLLRFMAGIYPVDSGTRDVQGSVYMYGGTTSINPDASGYENVVLAMRLNNLPLEREQEFQKDVEDFTELGEYLHMPTRVYSAGMMARLSFAIATLQTPEILLIDEGIGAGDAKFADKVEKRIKEFTNKAKIIVCASHSDALLRKMCTRGVVLNGGSVEYIGDIDEALDYYSNTHKSNIAVGPTLVDDESELKTA